jgi:hypothetical protein
MSIRIEAITFNHDTDSATHDACNIRRNYDEFIRPPEWRRAADGSVLSNPAAYSIKETRGNTISIRVALRSTAAGSAFVRAVGLDPLPHNTLADVAAREVVFDAAGDSVTEFFDLENVRLEAVGVNAYDVLWLWQQAPTADGPWDDFATTRHRVYAILREPVPRKPWRPDWFSSSNTQMPWADVLRWACRWARGARTPQEAASMITHEVYKLGRTQVAIPGETPGPLLTYNDVDFYARYSDNISLKCMSFLMRLNREVANGPQVNCDDCAAVVSTFSNILGCNLAQAWVGNDSFQFILNPVLAIGAGAGGWNSMEFQHHAVAWAGACDVDDEVFDACLMVDGDAHPGVNSHQHLELLPANLRFGRAGQRFYQWRLVLDDAEHLGGSAPKKNRTYRRVE